jgi:hypothetical protein
MPQEQQDRNVETGSGAGNRIEITPELVREVADKVYALMLKDLKISRERGRSSAAGYDNKGRKK